MTTPTGRRSVLSVPAHDAHKINKALGAGADEVVLDLEDAVAPAQKEAARDVLATHRWPEQRPLLAVRVNGIGTTWFEEDMKAVARVPVDSIVLPKTTSRADIALVERLLDDSEHAVGRAEPLGVQALIETAAGLTALADIVSAPQRLSSLLIGYADLAASLGRTRVDPSRWLVAQEMVLWHARAAGLEAVDGPHLGVGDDEPFRMAVTTAADAAFDAKWVIHPRQVGAVNEAFRPAAADVDHAVRVLEALEMAAAEGRGAVQLDGQLLDEAMAVSARRLLAKAGR